MSITISDLRKKIRFRNKISFTLFNGLNIEIHDSEVTSFLGSKGSGKTTLLKIIAGIGKSTTGEIKYTSLNKRSFLYYHGTATKLFNHSKNIEDNIRKMIKRNSVATVTELLEIFGLTQFRRSLPIQLSGATKVKFELSLLFAQNPDILLLDEPFIELDSYTRTILNKECLEIFNHLKKTVIISTNDVSEAIILSDQVAVLNEGTGSLKKIVHIDIDKKNLDSPDFIRIQELLYEELKHEKITTKPAGKINCWEFKKCGREPGGVKVSELGVCPAVTETKLNGVHGGLNSGRACWIVAGTYCKGEIQGSFAQKYKNCEKCEFYKLVESESADFQQINSLLIYMSRTEDEEKKKYRKILENMIDPSIISEALTNLEELKKGGEKNITAFFSDIVSFSVISERLSNAELFSFINEYLTAMTDIIKEEKGTIDKYIGDAVVAIFGAPVSYENTASHAARASMRMLSKLEELKKYWKDNNLYCPEVWNLKIRIGLNTGLAKMGFMGTKNLASYTMMGETVNIAQWMENTCKCYNVPILITNSTRKEIENFMVVRFIDYIHTKTKKRLIPVFEIAGLKGEVPSDQIHFIKLYQLGVKCFYKKKFDDSINYLSSALNIRKNDKAALIMLNRCTRNNNNF